MMHINVNRQMQRLAMLGAMILVFGQFRQFAGMPVRMPEVMAVGLAAPYSMGGTLANVLQQAALWHLDPAQQVFIYSRYGGSRSEDANMIRLWQGIMAVVAVFWIARVGRMLYGPWAGILAAFLLASVPPQLWNMLTPRVACTLLHMEIFLRALASNDPVWWGLWTLASWVLYCTGIFAEPVLLQAWFVCLGVCWWWWRSAAQFLPKQAVDRLAQRRQHARYRGTIWQRLQRDYGFLRYLEMLAVVSVVTTTLTIVGALFFSHLSFSVGSFALIVSLSGILSLALGVVMLFLPLFSRERKIVMEGSMDLFSTNRQTVPETIFFDIPARGFVHMVLAYAIAMVLFLPVLFLFHTHVDVFVTACDLREYWAYVRAAPLRTVLCSAVPLVFMLLVVVRFVLRRTSRARLVGAGIAVLCSFVYVVQARYAALSAPFYYICAAGLLAELLGMARGVVQRQTEKMAPAKAHQLAEQM
jgi:hypothetical protein